MIGMIGTIRKRFVPVAFHLGETLTGLLCLDVCLLCHRFLPDTRMITSKEEPLKALLPLLARRSPLHVVGMGPLPSDRHGGVPST